MVRIFAYLLIAFIYTSAYGQIIISEVCSSNLESHYDTYGETPDWVELRNISNYPVNINGWSLGDSELPESAWSLPDTILKPKEYIIVNCSGRAQNGSDGITLKASSKGAWEWYGADKVPFVYLPVSDDFKFQTEVRWYNRIGKWGNAGIVYMEQLKAEAENIGLYQMRKKGGAGRGNYNVYYRGQEGDILDADIDIQYHFDPWKFTIAIERVGDSIWLEITDHLDRLMFRRNYPNNIHSDFYGPDWESGFVGLSIAQNLTDSDSDITELASVTFENMQMNGQRVYYEDFGIEDFTEGQNSIIFEDNEIHTDFSISSNGETIYLWDANQILADTLEVPELRADEGYGRPESASLAFSQGGLLALATPNTDNSSLLLGRVEPFVPDLGAGLYSNELELIMESGDSEAVYYYTTNGSMPTKMDEVFGGILEIESNTALRVIGYRDGYMPSEEFASTYHIGETNGLPIYSIIADSLDLYAEEGGLLVDLDDQENEKRGYFEDHQFKRIWPVSLALQGELSRHYPQKSIKVETRKAYGSSYFNENFFDVDFDRYNDLVLRNHSNDWFKTLIRNQVAHLVAKNLIPLNTQYRPAQNFINGKYYGLITLTDRVNRNYLSHYYDIPEDNLVFVSDSAKSVKGDEGLLYEKISSIFNTNISADGSLNDINNIIDVKNFYDYFITNVQLYNYDWPWKNYKFWFSDNLGDGRVRFVFSDMDWVLGLNGAEAHYNKLSVLDEDLLIPNIYRHLLQNDQFRWGFINRYCDLLMTEFKVERVVGIIDSVATIYRPHIPRHRELYPDSAVDWEENIKKMIDFATHRNHWIYEHIKEYFDLSGSNLVTIGSSHPGNSRIEFSGLTGTTFPWEVKYMNDTPIRIKAIPSEGYRFIGWQESWLEDKEEIEVILSGDSTEITALFEKIPGGESDLHPLVTEIMYAPPKENDCGDWIEIFNPSSEPVDISGWSITDSRAKEPMVFSENLILPTFGSLVVAESYEQFNEVYIEGINAIIETPMPFGLSRDGDLILLFDKDNQLIDSVEYMVGGDWPDANRNGRSIELKDWQADNSIGSNWSVSVDSMGSPGSSFTGFNEYPEDVLFHGSSYSIAIENGLIDIKRRFGWDDTSYSLFDLMGKEITNGLGGVINLSGLPKGLYYLWVKSPSIESFSGNNLIIKILYN